MIVVEAKTKNTQKKPESGFALLMVIFVISLGTILVTAFGSETFSFLKRNIAITSGLEAEYASKSALTLAISALEMPDDPSLPIRPWQILNSMPSIPVPGFSGDIRVQVFDEGGKINLNAIMGSQTGFPSGTPPPVGGDNTGEQGAQVSDVSDFWKFTVADLLTQMGHGSNTSTTMSGREQNDPNQRTLGGVIFEPQQQVAVLHDWIDYDKKPFSSPHFPASGIEGPGNQQWFLNRPLQSLDELARVPGFTNDLLQRIAPYVRTGMVSDYKINVNTAPPLVLQVIGFSQDELMRVIQQRSVQWLTSEELQSIVQGSVNLSKVTTVSGSHYKIIVRAKSSSITKWLEADCILQSGFGKKVATIRKLRYY